MIKRSLLSPRVLIVGIWTVITLFSTLGSRERLHQVYEPGVVIFEPLGTVWILISIVIFLLGTVMADRVEFRLITYRESQSQGSGVPVAIILTSILSFILLYMYISTIASFGGLFGFLDILTQEWHTVSDRFAESKPFTPARLLYTGLVGCSLYFTSVLARVTAQQRSSYARLTVVRLVVLIVASVAPLAVLPIIASQRILIFSTIVGCLVVYSLVSDRELSIKYPIAGIVLFAAIWTLQEGVRVSRGGPVETLTWSFNLAAYYFQVGAINTTRAVEFIGSHSYGFYTFGFLFDYLFIESEVASRLPAEHFVQATQAKNSGPWPPLATPYIDFGWLGVVPVMLWGYICQTLYNKSVESDLVAQVYALFAVSIILSFHQTLYSNPMFLYNIAILVLLNYSEKFARYFARMDRRSKHWS